MIRLSRLAARMARMATLSAGLFGASLPAGAQTAATPSASTADEPEEAQRVLVRVFGNIDWLSRRHEDPNTFTLGQLDAFVVSELAPGLGVLAEVVLEAPREEEGQLAEVERFQLRFAPSDAFSVTAGRMHTVLGFWNQTYHHGSWLQTTAFRPEVYRWEDEAGGLLPVHEVGLRVSGTVSLRQARIEYSASLANGRAPRSSGVVTLQDPNGTKAVSGWLALKPRAVPNLQLGGTVVLDTIPPDRATARREAPLDERILGVFLAYPGPRFELLAEGFDVRHAEKAGAAWRSRGLYAQAAWAIGGVKPYYRFDWIDAGEGDPYLAETTDLTKHTLGLRLDPWKRLALKAEVSRSRSPRAGAASAAAIQAAFTF